MAESFLLSVGSGVTSDYIDLMDTSTIFINRDGGFEVVERSPEQLVLSAPLIMRGSTPDIAMSRYQSVQLKINQARIAVRPNQPVDGVTLGVQRNVASMVYFDVLDGSLSSPTLYNGGNVIVSTLLLTCEPFARGAPIAGSASATLNNGAATVLVEDVPGDASALATVTVRDVSTSTAVINRLRMARRSRDAIALGDWDPVVDVSLRGSASTITDASAFGGSYVQSGTITAWRDVARATMPAGIDNQGRFGIWGRIKDQAALMATPTGLSGTVTNNRPVIRQSSSNSATASATTIAVSWDSATATDSALLLVAKAHKSITKRVITTIADDTGNAGETTITTSATHGFVLNDRVEIAGVEANDPDINGAWDVVRVPSTTTFNIAIDTVTAGAGGTARRVFDETFTPPAGWAQVESVFTASEGIVKAGSRVGTPATIEQSRTVVWYKPAATAESGSKSVTFSSALTYRSIALIEIDNAALAGTLGIIATGSQEYIYDAPATSQPNEMLVGIAFGRDQSFAPGLGFVEIEDTGGLVVATRSVDKAGVYNWRASPDDYDYPLASILLSVIGDDQESSYKLAAGTYPAQVHVVDATGNPSNATASINTVLTLDDSAISYSWSLPGGNVAYSVLSWQDLDGQWRTIAVSGNSYLLTDPDDGALLAGDPRATTGAVKTPLEFRVRVGVADETPSAEFEPVSTLTDGVFRLVYFGSVALQDDWVIDVAARTPSGINGNASVDALWLLPEEAQSQTWLTYHGLNLATKREWIYEIDRHERVHGELHDLSTGALVGSAKRGGQLTIPPGNSLLHVVADIAGGQLELTNTKMTVTVDIVPRWTYQS